MLWTIGVFLTLGLAGPALAGGSTSFSYGAAGLPNGHDVGVESVLALRTTVYPGDGPVGLGVSARAHGGPTGYDAGVTPDLCAGTVQDEFTAQICGGLTVFQRGWRDGASTHGLLSPVVEPSFGIPLGDGDHGALFFSVPVGYDVRYDGQGGWWGGLTIGFGAFGS